MVTIVIVNYRTAELTIDCLRSLSDEVRRTDGDYAVVVDNASGDGSAAKIVAAIEREGWEAWAHLMSLDHNGGYAAGNNAGLRMALAAQRQADYVLFLNPDTLVRSGGVRELVAFMEAHTQAGTAGSLVAQLPAALGALARGSRLCVSCSFWATGKQEGFA